MSMNDSSFSGFEQSNTTPVPDVLFDKLAMKSFTSMASWLAIGRDR